MSTTREPDRPNDEPTDSAATASGLTGPPAQLADSPAALGEVITGRWQVRQIRRGGQAWVLIVDDLAENARRVLKFPFAGMALTGDTEIVAMLGLAPHPRLVTAYDVVDLGDRRGLLLEYVPGSMAETMSQHRPLASHDQFRPAMLQEICDGMAYLSEHGEFAHLDLKPSNLLIDEVGHVKVADFGMARAVQIRNGRYSPSSGGTWAYAAPEVLALDPADSRADIFSFGIILHEIYTGERPYPFQLSRDGQTQRAQLLDYYRSSEFQHWLAVLDSAGGVDTVIAGCMYDFRERRPPSFRHVAKMLATALAVPAEHAEPARLPLQQVEIRRLARVEALVRLRHDEEAVRSVNVLLRAPSSPGVAARARRAAVQALTGAGRPDEAALLKKWGPDDHLG